MNNCRVGRPSSFDAETATKIIDLYTTGYTDKEVAKIIGVHPNTILNWRKANREFLWSTNEAKAIADSIVETALFKRAVGMTYFEDQVSKDGVQTLRKYALPSVQAQQFWLKNRKPEKWRERFVDKRLVEVMRGFQNMSNEDLLEAIEIQKAKLLQKPESAREN